MSTQVKGLSTHVLINVFVNKACCEHTQDKARSFYNQLEKKLTEDEAYQIRLAWYHSRHGEGNAELFDLGKRLYKKYSV